MVLMMAMAGGADTAAFGNKGCNGCSGYSCSGYSCSGCSGCWSSCHGCHGGGLFGRHNSCHGCSGCSGCWSSSSCHGCSGCSGCWSSSSCHGCHGGLFGRHNSCHGCNGCSGYNCCGCNGYVTTGCTGCWSTPAAPAAMPVVPAPATKKAAFGPAPAVIVVSLPAEAKLTIDGAATKATETTRTFVTPALETGATYYYELTAEVVRDGKPVVATEKVAVKAGETTTVALQIPTATAVASK
jgi:uncharacterized protein (TIGR03000 family)